MIIATVGSLIKRKGIDLLIRSLAALMASGEEVQLLIIGSGPEREALMALAVELGVAERVHFLGERPDSAAILRGGVDLLVSGAREEVFGLTLAEAGMLGLPVSAYRVGGIPEVVEEGVTGLLATPGDWAEMADHWRQLSNPQRRCEMGRPLNCVPHSCSRWRATLTGSRRCGTPRWLVVGTPRPPHPSDHSCIGRGNASLPEVAICWRVGWQEWRKKCNWGLAAARCQSKGAAR